MMDSKSIRAATIGLASVAITTLIAPNAVAETTQFSPHVDGKGNISFPSNFRTSMAHLGSWYVPDGGASGFHDVYTEKSSIEAFRRTGQFPDGATLVKELRASNKANYTTGQGVSHSTKELKQWFVMVKDSKGRFSDNPIWGDGWGWALFKPENRVENVAADYKTDCLGCHVPAKGNDWIYTEAYPMLLESD
ncbi:cytochrome P460 family protein [Vibrio sp. DNB22_10_4]